MVHSLSSTKFGELPVQQEKYHNHLKARRQANRLVFQRVGNPGQKIGVVDARRVLPFEWIKVRNDMCALDGRPIPDKWLEELGFHLGQVGAIKEGYFPLAAVDSDEADEIQDANHEDQEMVVALGIVQ